MKQLATFLFLLFSLASVGQEWENLNPGGGGQIQGVTCDPNTPGRMFLNSDVEGCYRSTNYGLSWIYTGKELEHHMSFITAVEPGNSNRVYNGTLYGLHLSDNGGMNWTVVNGPMRGFATATITIDPSNVNNIYVGNSWYIKDAQMGTQKEPAEATTGLRNIWISKDRGVTWQTINYEPIDGYKQCYTITIDPLNNERVYLGAHSGLYRSINGGTSFTKITPPTGMTSCRGFDISPNGQFAYAVFTPNETVTVAQPNVYVGTVDNATDTWTWTLIASAGTPNGLYYASGVTTYYWKPIVDPRSTTTEHKVIIGCMSSQANSSQGLYEFTGTVNGSSVTGSWSMVFGQSGTNGFNFDMGWNNISPQVRQYNYTPISWPERKVLLASQQSLYYGDPAVPNNTVGKYQVLSTEFINTFGSFRTYKTRGFQSTVNFDGAGWGNYVAQAMADNRILESWNGGVSWTQSSRPGTPSGENCDYVEIIPPNGSNAALVITAAGGGFGGTNDAADAAHWGKYLTDPATASNTWVSLEQGTSGLPGASSRTYGAAYNPQDPKNVILATQNGLYETFDIYARIANTGGAFSIIGPPAGTIFKFGDVFFDPDNGNIVFAHTGNTIYKLTRTAIGQPWTLATVQQAGTTMGGGHFYYWKNGATSYMAYASTGVQGQGPRVFLSVNESAFTEILNRAGVLAVHVEPWLANWTNGVQMHITFSGIAGFQNQIILGSQVEDGKHGYTMLRGIINNNGSVTWENWSGQYGTPEFMEVARLWDGKVLTHPDAQGVTRNYYYAATRGAGLWRRELQSNVTLPVNMTRLNAFIRQRSAFVQWRTAEEASMQQYIVERSINGSTYTKIGTIAPRHTATANDYIFEDNTIANLIGLIYYRLKMMNNDGSFRYSSVVTVRLDETSGQISLFPNPSPGISIINHPPLQKGSVLQVFAMDGKAVYQKNLPDGSSQNYVNWDGMQPGRYQVVVFSGKEKYTSSLIIR